MSSKPPEFARFELPGGIHLAVNSNHKMKTVSVRLAFVTDLDEATVTRHSLLPMALRRGTRRLPDLQRLNRYLEGLYGASLDAGVQKLGEWQVIRYRLDVVGDRFLPGGTHVLRDGLELARELLIDPLVVDGGFHPEYLEQEKANLERLIDSLIDSKGAWAAQRLIEEMCPDEPYRLYEQGRVADLEAIDATELLELQRSAVAGYPLHIHVAGDLPVEEARDLVGEALSGTHLSRRAELAIRPIPAASSPGSPREVTETLDIQQARLHLGYRHGITLAGDDDDHAALLVMNGVLGGFSHSKLFQNVREKASLCYSVGSSLDRTKGLLFIASGIAPENRDQALAIIGEQVDAIARGEISDDEIAATLSTLLNQNEMLEDNLVALAEVDLRWQLHGKTLDLAALRERLARVGRDDIARVAGRLKLDTIYTLTR